MRKFGIDISRWQRGIDFDAIVRDSVEFVILRGAYTCDKDSCFDAFYSAAKARGLGVGVYQYSMAESAAEARSEALYLIENVLSGRQLDYPIYLDVEDSVQKALGKSTMDEIINAWAEVMEAHKYFCGVYCNGDFYRNYCSGSELSQRYTWWYAAWSNDEVTAYSMWQFGGSTNEQRSPVVAGMVCDQDYAYEDFPSIIKGAGLNGYSGGDSSETETIVQNDQVVTETEKGDERAVTLTLNYLQLGDCGAQVLTLQALLNEFNNACLAKDGVFGNATYAAVLDYQRSRHLSADGVVGAETWTQLLLK